MTTIEKAAEEYADGYHTVIFGGNELVHRVATEVIFKGGATWALDEVVEEAEKEVGVDSTTVFYLKQIIEKLRRLLSAN